jgi:hypothetical protein
MQPAENQRVDAIDDRIVASQTRCSNPGLGRRVIAALMRARVQFADRGAGRSASSRSSWALAATLTQDAGAERSIAIRQLMFPVAGVECCWRQYSSPETAASIANTLADTYVMWTRGVASQPTCGPRLAVAQIDALRRLADSAAVERFGPVC